MMKMPSRLRRLDDALYHLSDVDGAMLLSELDGFLTGIVLSPDPVGPAVWLPSVWGGGAVPFEDPVDMRWFEDMVAARRDEIGRDLARGRPRPIFDVDERNGEVLWEPWAAGFGAAMALRPDSWSALAAGSDADAAAACAGMTMLVGVATDETALTSVEINAVCDEAPALIDRHVSTLYARRQTHAVLAEAAPRPAKVGRNDPCPCGSGRKHKRCCGVD